MLFAGVGVEEAVCAVLCEGLALKSGGKETWMISLVTGTCTSE